MTRLALAVMLVAGLLTAPAHARAAEPVPDGAAVDQFDAGALGPDWTVLSRDDSRWSLTEQPGSLRVHALPGDTYQGTNTARNLFLMDIPAGDFEVVTSVRAPVALDFQSAGILAWQDWDNYVRTGLAHVGSAGGQVIETDTEVGAAFTAAFSARPGSSAEIVKLTRTGAEFVSSTWDGAAWKEASRVTADIDVRQVGLFALAAQNGTSMAADFDYFAVRAAPGQPVVPEGTFTLRHAGEDPYLSADASGAVRATAKPPMTSLALTAEPGGQLKDADTGKYLEVSGSRVRLGATGSAFQLTDAGGGKVTVTSGDRHLAVSGGRLVAGAGAGKFRVEGYTTGELTVDTGAKGKKVGRDLYGVFYEDINHAADGGLYAELVQNRSFEFDRVDEPSYHGLTAWSEVERGGTAAAAVSGELPLNPANRNYLRLEVTGGPAGVLNAGFNTGLPLKRGERYDLSFWARRDTPGTVTVTVESGSDAYGKAAVKVRAGGWTKYETSFRATGTTDAGRLVLLAPEGRTDLDMVSLFPRDTFKNRPNGMREDLARLIADLEPRFLRFPGGCVTNVGTYDPYSENQDRRRIYQWKETIGPVEERPANFNFWGYNQSYGIGFYEYFQFAEDLGAEALPVLSVGVNGCGENRPLTDPAKLDRWVQDTLDLIEFANGPVTSPWGKKRAELGHPKPFGLDYIGLGNEEIYPEFFDNYPKFANAIKAKYPDIKIISNAGQTSQGAWFDRMWQFARDQKADLVDEHYYNNPDWFLTNNRRYDSYDREGPKVFVGEYASRGNTFFNALSEASYLTGIERNADVVELAAYAPLLANVDYVDWTPDLIWFDNDEAYGSPSYHVQKLFSTNVGDTVLPSTFEGTNRPVEDISGAVGLGSWNTSVQYDDVKVTAADGTVLLEDDFAEGSARWRPGAGTWAVQDGAYAQTALVEDARSTAGSADWSNYTMELTARKIGGAEGFLVMFGVRDSGNFYWWNLGGWNNTQSAVEKAVNGAKASIATSATTIETGRDYRLKVEVSGRQITLWLDGQKVNAFTDHAVVEPLYQVVSKDAKSGDLVIKAVNAQDTAVRGTVDLGRARVGRTATVTSLTGSPSDVNSIADPDRIAPVEQRVTGFSRSFAYDFPAHSVTFIRLSGDR
ncbi:alpha-L-arabinofuranosidase C-terminal domain-containing protein [Nonomuraea harbinensis]|uniref:Alpha-L-arabinofuranosidase C-terminal domain-containing protein n=1 Tax=Nonomuraea harbinensis TaxID=1286938 RepID=A0ABW1BLT8_9ACTN|nr:alpha-L-arabinofuranosidase C-terminal domain-containing protein [Nonomuraea harbinensis]